MSKRKSGFYPRKKIPSYEIVAEKLSNLFKEKNWNWGDKITIYGEVRTFIRKNFFVRKGSRG